MTAASDYLEDILRDVTDRSVERMDVDPGISQKTVEAFRIPDTTFLGALAATGGFSISDGRLRLYGSAGPTFPSLLSMNASEGLDPMGQVLIIANDIYGNFYGINTGYSDQFRLGEILAFFADGTDWESTADNLEDFVSYCFLGELDGTFIDFETGDAQLEASTQSDAFRAINFYPPLFAQEGDPKSSHKSVVPISELMSLRLSFTQMG